MLGKVRQKRYEGQDMKKGRRDEGGIYSVEEEEEEEDNTSEEEEEKKMEE